MDKDSKIEIIEKQKSFAGKACIDVYGLFDELEIIEQLTPIRDAWEVGKELYNLTTKCNL